MIISDLSLKNRTTVFVLMFLLAVSGAWAYLSIPREAAPDVKVPVVLVMCSNRGVGPSDIENTVAIPLEKNLEGVDDLKELTTISAEGMATVVLEFNPSIEVEDALRKVKDRVDKAKGELPQEADAPIVQEINISEFPIMVLTIHGKAHEDRTRNLMILKKVAEDLKDEIERVPGVLEVVRVGGLTPEVRIEIDPNKLAAYRIPASMLVARYQGEDVKISAGSANFGSLAYDIRVPMEFERDIEAARNIVVNENRGRAVYLGDLAQIVPGFEDEKSFSRFDGEEAVSLLVQKKTGANIIAIATMIKEGLKGVEASGRLPEGVRVAVTNDESKFIKQLVDDLDNNILTGFFLVVAVVMVAMGFRNSLFVALAIPYSFLITLTVVWIQGITLNFVVLFSLIMSLGMVVDCAIVVVENIFRHRQMGKDPIEAARFATSEVAWPVITSTLTTVAAFAPLLFWPGIVGDFLFYFPYTVTISLSASLCVALVINPVVCSRFMTVSTSRRWGEEGRKLNAGLRFYKRVLEVSLRWKWAVALGAFAMLIAMAALFATFGPGVEFFPTMEPHQAYVDVVLPEGTRIEKTDAVVREIEKRVLAADPAKDVKHMVASVGSTGVTGHVFASSTAPNIGRVSLEFKDIDDRTRRSSDLVEDLRRAVSDIAGAEIRVEVEGMGPPSGKPVNIEIAGEDFELLGQLSAKTKRIVRDIPGVVGLKDDYEPGRPELQVKVDRKRAALLGLNPLLVGLTLQTAYRGSKVGVVRYGEEEYDVRVIAPEAERRGFGLLDKLYLTTLTGGLVPASAVASWDITGGSGKIRRVDRQRVVTVSSDVAKGFLADDVRRRATRDLEKLKEELPSGYGLRLTGEEQEMKEAQSFLSKAFFAALFFITLILIAQFNSIRIPLIIMSAVVLSLVGVFIGLLVLHMPFGIIMTGVGVISLAGVVVNNGIVLLDFTQQLRGRGMCAFDSVVEAGVTRFRPVMLTAITTVFGLLPMGVGLSFDFHQGRIAIAREMAQWWGPLAVAVIFGLSIATILTLVVAPNLYAILMRVKPPEQETGPRECATEAPRDV